MSRPSIFSNNYEKIMRRRKRVRNTIIIAVIIIAGIVFSYLKGILNFNFQQLLPRSMSQKKDSKMTTTEANENSNKKADSKKNTDNNDKFYFMKINDSLIVKVIYEDNNGTKKLKTVDSSSGNVQYSISPQGSGIVVYDSKNQGIIYMDANGNTKDITYKQYTDTSSNTFVKADVINLHPNYDWCDSPRLISENIVVYLSQLPWISDEGNKYVWTYNMSSDTYKCYYDTYGKNVSFGDITEKGLSITADGQQKYMDANGNITQ